MRKATLVEKECEFCHKKYTISVKSRKRLRYCSSACRSAAHKQNGFDRACPICGNVFHTTKSLNQKYCSSACYSKAQATKEHQDKYKATLRKKYGVESAYLIPGVKEKVKATCMKNHGVSCALQHGVLREIGRETCEKLYGDRYPQRTQKIKSKIQDTCIKRYGAPSVLGSRLFRERVKKDMLDRYGVAYTSQLRMNSRARSVLASKDSMKAYIETKEDRSAVLMYTELGIDDTTFYSYLDKYDLRHLVTHSSSHYETEIKSYFPNIHFIKDRKILQGKEIDLYSPEHKIGIEFNGSYWHSDAVHSDKEFHYKKSAEALSKGVFIFHIFEFEWVNATMREKIISRLNTIFKLNNSRIYARKCVIVEVQSREASEFYNMHHLQGKCAAKHHIGLKFNGELVACMSFRTNGINKNYNWELCRFACKSGYTISGGASKLFKHFVKTYNPGSVISYSDIAKSTGALYKTLGFDTIGRSHPQYVWVANGTKFLTRYQTQIKQLIKLGWKIKDDGLTEDQIMRSKHYYKLYDCGKQIWVYKQK